MWLMIPQVLLYDDLTSTACNIFGLLVSEGACYLTDFEISELLNVTESAVRDNIKALENKQLIEIVEGDGVRRIVPDFTILQNKFGTNLAFSTSTSTLSSDVQSKVYFCSDEQKSNKSKGVNDIVRKVFDYWNTRRREILSARGVFSRNAKLTAKRRSCVLSRLSAGRTEEEIKKAIDGCLSSDYHVENGYIDLTLICRDDEKLDRFIIRYEQNKMWEDVGPKLRVLND